MKILITEDDTNLGIILSEYLIAKGHDVTLATDGEQGLFFFEKETFDFCILDIMMPKKDGFTLAKEIRSVNKTIPIIFLTAKSMNEDTIEGFKVGADDYMTKPFSMEVLLARMDAIVRRTEKTPSKEQKKGVFIIGKLVFDSNKQLLTSKENEQKLTSKENELLKLLVEHKNTILDRSEALKKIWKDDSYYNSRSMDVYITKLRKYLKTDSEIEIINVHGQGFKLRCD